MKSKIIRNLIIIITINFLNCYQAYFDSTIQPYYRKSIEFNQKKISKNMSLTISYSEANNINDRLIGVKKNGYGFETGNVYTKIEPDIFLKNAMSKELKAIGVDISEGGSENIEIKINKIFIEPHGLFSEHLVAVIDIEAFAFLKKAKYKRRFKGIGTAYAPLRIGFFYEVALENSLENLLSKLVSGIYYLIRDEEKYLGDLK